MSPDYEVVEQELQVTKQRLAETRRNLYATHQALLDERAARRNDAVIAAPAGALAAVPIDDEDAQDDWQGAFAALRAACRATTPSPTPATHTVVALAELERLRKADRYLQEYLDGYLDMDDLEDVRTAKGGAS